MSVKELARITGKGQTTIYNLCKKLGRLPTIEEVQEVKPKGRPRKWK